MVEETLAFRAGVGNGLEPIVIDAQLGEFCLSEEAQIEARDIKPTEALYVHLHGSKWKKLTVVQAVAMLLAANRPVGNSVQPIPIPRA